MPKARKKHVTVRRRDAGSMSLAEEKDEEDKGIESLHSSSSRLSEGDRSVRREKGVSVIDQSVHPPFRPTLSTISIRKRKLELLAAEEAAVIKRRAIEERERVELELIEKRLAAELNDEDNVNQEFRDGSVITGGSFVTLNRTEEWLRDTSKESAAWGYKPSIVGPPSNASGRETIPDKIITTNFINRLSLNKSLLEFSGDSLDWLRFKNAFELSTRLGGYSDSENVARLHQCLKGEAREAVSSLLITATNANQIIETLQLRFGNPEVVIDKVIKEIRMIPKFSANRPDILTLATKVKNGVAAIIALEHTGYLHSPELVREILSKIPAAMIYHYNRYVSYRPAEEPRLVTLAEFLYSEAELACRAGTTQLQPTTSQSNDRGSYQSRNTSKSVFNAIEESVESLTEEKENCTHCGSQEHFIVECEQFKSKSVKERWDWLRGKGLCFRCLKKGHLRINCKSKKCGKNGCKRMHHALLHESTSKDSS